MDEPTSAAAAQDKEMCKPMPRKKSDKLLESIKYHFENPKLADLFATTRSELNCRLNAIEEETRDAAQEIKEEAKSHCLRIREGAVNDIANNKRLLLEVKAEYCRLISSVIETFEEQMKEISEAHKKNEREIKATMYMGLADKIEKTIQMKKVHNETKGAEYLAVASSNCILTFHLFIVLFIFFGVYASYCK